MPRPMKTDMYRFRDAVTQTRLEPHDTAMFERLIPLWVSSHDGLVHRETDDRRCSVTGHVTTDVKLWSGTLDELTRHAGLCRCALNYPFLHTPGQYVAASRMAKAAELDLRRLQAEPEFVRHHLCARVREQLTDAAHMVDAEEDTPVLDERIGALRAELDEFETCWVPQWHAAHGEVDTWLWWAAFIHNRTEYDGKLSQFILRGGSVQEYAELNKAGFDDELELLRTTVQDPELYTTMVVVSSRRVIRAVFHQCDAVSGPTAPASSDRVRIIGALPSVVTRALLGDGLVRPGSYRNMGEPLNMSAYRFLLESWEGTPPDDLLEMARCCQPDRILSV